jgi:hypothetical protein
VATTIKARYQSRVNQCYQRALKGNPNLQGKVNLSFTIGIAGNVVKAKRRGLRPRGRPVHRGRGAPLALRQARVARRVRDPLHPAQGELKGVERRGLAAQTN